MPTLMKEFNEPESAHSQRALMTRDEFIPATTLNILAAA